MTTRKALIVYATKYGQPEQIARFISDRLAEKMIECPVVKFYGSSLQHLEAK